MHTGKVSTLKIRNKASLNTLWKERKADRAGKPLYYHKMHTLKISVEMF